MISGSLSRRYAKALFAIGSDDKSIGKMGEQISWLGKSMKEVPELGECLGNPAFPKVERRQILTALFDKISALPTVRNFGFLLLDKDRLAVLPAIATELMRLINETAGRVSATVTSATPLTQVQLSYLRSALETVSGKKVDIEKKEDPSLIGGIVAQVGDLVYDNSLRTQLEQIKRAMVAK